MLSITSPFFFLVSLLWLPWLASSALLIGFQEVNLYQVLVNCDTSLSDENSYQPGGNNNPVSTAGCKEMDFAATLQEKFFTTVEPSDKGTVLSTFDCGFGRLWAKDPAELCQKPQDSK